MRGCCTTAFRRRSVNQFWEIAWRTLHNRGVDISKSYIKTFKGLRLKAIIKKPKHFKQQHVGSACQQHTATHPKAREDELDVLSHPPEVWNSSWCSSGSCHRCIFDRVLGRCTWALLMLPAAALTIFMVTSGWPQMFEHHLCSGTLRSVCPGLAEQ